MSDFRLALITMAYNEAVNLPIWLAYYRRAAPGAQLFVVDHGSTDGSAPERDGVNVIRLPRTQMDENVRARFVQNLHAALLGYYHMVIYTDCDELIVVDPLQSPCLSDYLETTRYQYASPVGLNIHHILHREPSLLESETILSQRRYARFRSNMCKPLISRVRMAWEPGFHRCNRPLNIDRSLFLFHTKCADKDRALDRHRALRDIRWSRRALDARHGAHQRYPEGRFLQDFFIDPDTLFKRDGPKPFVFDTEIAAMEAECRADGKGQPRQIINGPIVEIPERFHTLF